MVNPITSRMHPPICIFSFQESVPPPPTPLPLFSNSGFTPVLTHFTEGVQTEYMLPQRLQRITICNHTRSQNTETEPTSLSTAPYGMSRLGIEPTTRHVTPSGTTNNTSSSAVSRHKGPQPLLANHTCLPLSFTTVESRSKQNYNCYIYYI